MQTVIGVVVGKVLVHLRVVGGDPLFKEVCFLSMLQF